jgi:hypothetical protein
MGYFYLFYIIEVVTEQALLLDIVNLAFKQPDSQRGVQGVAVIQSTRG